MFGELSRLIEDAQWRPQVIERRGKPVAVMLVDTERSLRASTPTAEHERRALIGAAALTHGLTLATRNTRDFAGCGCRLFDPFA